MFELYEKKQLAIAFYKDGERVELEPAQNLTEANIMSVLAIAKVLADNGRKILAIKEVRNLFNIGLRDAKNLVENIAN